MCRRAEAGGVGVTVNFLTVRAQGGRPPSKTPVCVFSFLLLLQRDRFPIKEVAEDKKTDL